MKLNDAIFGLVLLVLGATVLISVQAFPKIPGQPVGPALFPGLIAAGLCIAGFLLIVNGVRNRANQHWLVWDDWVSSPRHVVAVLVLLGAVVFYIVASDRLGFLPTAVVILVALFSALRVPFWRAVFIAVIAAVVVHFAFYKLLRVPLPWGVLMPYAW
jgi:putative tricarboxylic transport membrane protein